MKNIKNIYILIIENDFIILLHSKFPLQFNRIAGNITMILNMNFRFFLKNTDHYDAIK